jgi:alkylation response protein AidB-like acyl-CoA dehydrogenase
MLPVGAPRRLAINRSDGLDAVRSAAEAWVADNVPLAWRQAASQGRAAIRAVRSRADYEAWYPTFADSGLVVATWPVAYGGLDLTLAQARVAEEVLAPYNLGRLNPLGLNNTAPVLFAHGSEQQRLRFLPPLVRNEERWCQLFSEPGAGSDLASLATRAIRDGDQWALTGQKVWSTWAHLSDWGICLARTDPTRPKREGITYFLVDLRTRGVEIRPLRHLGGDVDFNEVFLDHVRVPDSCRVGPVNDGWRVAASTLAGERQMVSGAGSGGVDRIGGSGAHHLMELARSRRQGDDAVVRQRLAGVYSEEQIRSWTNERGRATVASNDRLSRARSIGKLHQSELNQRTQLLAVDVLGCDAVAWAGPSDGSPDAWAEGVPYEVKGMLRSLANTIEAGTSEVNRNVLGEKVLGLPREPDPWQGSPWQDIPHS